MFSTKFVAATTEYTTYYNSVPAPYLRKTINISKELKSAEITICGLGFYELYINGKHITKGALAPYIANPDDILYYDNYDLSDLLNEGENVIGIMLGNGILNCPSGAVWQFSIAKFRSAPKVAFAVELEYADGDKETIEADESVKTHPSPILFDELRCGETYDARLEIDGWNLPAFDDSDWNNAIKAERPRGETVICPADPIVVTKELKPVKIWEGKIGPTRTRPDVKIIPLPDDENVSGYIYDFGVNLAGTIRLNIKGDAGQKVCMQFAELLDDNNDLDMRGMTFQPPIWNHRARYYLKGTGTESYTPRFTYFGFRYCLVTGITKEQATADLLTYVVMNSDLKENGAFSCSDEIVNKLQQATINSDLSNFYYFPTDCPHREKNGWTADAALSAEQLLFNFTAENSLKEWLRSIRYSQRIDGALPGIVPTGGWGFNWGNGPAWDAVLFYLPYYIWIYRGDTEVIKENADAMMKYLNYISKKRDLVGLIHIGLGDWLHVNKSVPKAPLDVTDTLVSMDICSKASQMFGAIGLNIQKAFADALFSELRAAARTSLIEADGCTVMGRCQSSQAMAIKYGLFEGGEKQAAFNILLKFIHEANDHMDIGVLGSRVIFHVLSDFGYSDLAYKMITRPEYPSYGYCILKQNATTLFESFKAPGDVPNSKNHHFWGDISSWFIRCIVGIKVNPNARDVNEIEISPSFIEGLDHAEGYINVPAGKVEVSWKREEDKILLNINLPKECFGYVRLPDGYITDTDDSLTVHSIGFVMNKRNGKLNVLKHTYSNINI